MHGQALSQLNRKCQALEAENRRLRNTVNELSGKLNRSPDWETFERMRDALERNEKGVVMKEYDRRTTSQRVTDEMNRKNAMIAELREKAELYVEAVEKYSDKKIWNLSAFPKNNKAKTDLLELL